MRAGDVCGRLARISLLLAAAGLAACAQSARDRHFESHARVVQPQPGDGSAMAEPLASGGGADQRRAEVPPPRD